MDVKIEGYDSQVLTTREEVLRLCRAIKESEKHKGKKTVISKPIEYVSGEKIKELFEVEDNIEKQE